MDYFVSEHKIGLSFEVGIIIEVLSKLQIGGEAYSMVQIQTICDVGKAKTIEIELLKPKSKV